MQMGVSNNLGAAGSNLAIVGWFCTAGSVAIQVANLGSVNQGTGAECQITYVIFSQ
jgi:hypothetical protein